MDPSAFLPIALLFIAGMMLLSFRKQRRQMQETQQMQADLADGDVVITTSGLRATVVDASYEDTLDLEIAPGVVTTWVRAAIREKVQPETDAAVSDGDGAGSETPDTPAGDTAGDRNTA